MSHKSLCRGLATPNIYDTYQEIDEWIFEILKR